MTAFFLFVGVYIIASIVQSIIRKTVSKQRKRKTAKPAAMVEYKPIATVQENPPENNAVLNALIESKNTIIDSISEIDYLLDNAAHGREKLIDRRLKLLDKLAAVEIKINKYS